MPSLLQLESWVKQEIAKGKGHLHTNHVEIIEEAVTKRVTNKEAATKIAWDCKDPESYKAWHKERERWMQMAGSNPILATDSMIVALRMYDEKAMRIILENLQKVGEQQRSGS